MKIKELIRQLQIYSPNAEVFMASDSEGNSFANIHEAVPTDQTITKIIIWPMHERLEEVE